jgi:hypothetical protein
VKLLLPEALTVVDEGEIGGVKLFVQLHELVSPLVLLRVSVEPETETVPV